MQVRQVRVQIETTRLRIVGTIRLPTEGYRSRTTDFLNAHETGFIAVTDAEVLGDGPAPQRHDYMAVGCRHIVAAAELEDLGVTEDRSAATPAVPLPEPEPEAAADAAPRPVSVPPPVT
jgi:hypothetical protein